MSDKIIPLPKSVSRWARLLHIVSEWNHRRTAKAELRAMPEYLLRDIGMLRSDINARVDGVAVQYRTSAEILELSAARPTTVARPVTHAQAA